MADSLHELAACPFCGGPASVVYDSGNEVWGQSWYVGCTLCSVKFKAMGSSSWAVKPKEDEAAKAKAIACWNTRAARQDSEVAALRETLKRVESLIPFWERLQLAHADDAASLIDQGQHKAYGACAHNLRAAMKDDPA